MIKINLVPKSILISNPPFLTYKPATPVVHIQSSIQHNKDNPFSKRHYLIPNS